MGEVRAYHPPNHPMGRKKVSEGTELLLLASDFKDVFGSQM
jgi:hypothetical protein